MISSAFIQGVKDGRERFPYQQANKRGNNGNPALVIVILFIQIAEFVLKDTHQCNSGGFGS